MLISPFLLMAYFSDPHLPSLLHRPITSWYQSLGLLFSVNTHALGVHPALWFLIHLYAHDLPYLAVKHLKILVTSKI